MFHLLPPLLGYAPFLVPLPVAWAVWAVLRWRAETVSRAALSAAQDAGLDQPPSLHPVINPKLCIGCGACTFACPEGAVLGLINGKAELVEPAACIGHGACKTACPTGAIDLVFGTETRGFDIPLVTPDFESTVPGLFIAGELGGMGLIANAIEQGRQAVTAIGKLDGIGRKDRYDLVIIGAGPAGFAASLAAKKLKLNAVTLEQDTLGGTVAHYPRNKIVMTQPAHLPLYGKVTFRRVRKETLLAVWQKVARKTGVRIRYNEQVHSITRGNGVFEVISSKGSYATRSVLLAVGRRGTPRTLGVPGEELPKVLYRLGDASQYRGRRVLVVGGGDSALEAALDLAQQAGTRVTLCHRSASFSRAKPENRRRLQAAELAKIVMVLRETTITTIKPDSVQLTCQGMAFRLANDIVIICAGGLLPAALLASAGVDIETKYGTA